MSDRVKRVLFAVAFLLFAGGIGFAMYWVFFQGGTIPGIPGLGPAPTQEPTDATREPGTGSLEPSGPAGDRNITEPPSGDGLPVSGGAFGGDTQTTTDTTPQTAVLRDGLTQNVSRSTNGLGARYYNPDDGKFYRVDNGATTALSETSFPRAETVAWGNSSDQAVITFPDGRNIHFNFQTGAQNTLPSHWEDFAFSPDDTKIVTKAIATSPDARFLVVSDPDGSNSRAIEPLGNNANLVTPTWSPNNQIVAFALTGNPQGLDRQEVLMVGQNHENFRALQVEGRGFMPNWSPDGATVLYSVWSAASDYRPELWVSGGSASNMNQNRTKLGINTWADKCVWKDIVTIYCAVPNNLPRGAGLQPELFRDTTDTFVKIDLRSGAQLNLGTPEGAGAITSPVLTNNGDAILFTDGRTGRLYQFNLP